LLRRIERIPSVLDAIESGTISDADLTSAQVDFLRDFPVPAISQRARRLFGNPAPARPAIMAQFQPAFAAGRLGRGRPRNICRPVRRLPFVQAG